jgi:hypothetical protein
VASGSVNELIERIFATCHESQLGSTMLGQAREVFEYRSILLEAGAELSTLPSSATDMSRDQVLRSFELSRRQVAMLRAALVLTDQLHSDVLCVITNDRKATVTKVLADDVHRSRFAALDGHALLLAYRLRMFRNKLVTHPPGELVGASMGNGLAHEARRLAPMRWRRVVSDDDVERVRAVARDAVNEVSGVAEELADAGNIWALLQLLFDGVEPLSEDGQRSVLRQRVDKLVGELGGVASPTMEGVVKTMVAFLAALADHAEDQAGR